MRSKNKSFGMLEMVFIKFFESGSVGPMLLVKTSSGGMTLWWCGARDGLQKAVEWLVGL